jgi:hypothetical protein
VGEGSRAKGRALPWRVLRSCAVVAALGASACGSRESPPAEPEDTLEVEQAPGGFLTFELESESPRTARDALGPDDPLVPRFVERAGREVARLRFRGRPLAPLLEKDARLSDAWRRALGRPLVSQATKAPGGGYRVVLQADLREFLRELAPPR